MPVLCWLGRCWPPWSTARPAGFGWVRNSPSRRAPYALTAALAAEAAGARGSFWEMHDLLFQRQDRLRDADLARYAESLGLPGGAVVGDAAQPYGDKVEADFRSGVDSGVRGTPTLFVDGRRYIGRVDLPSLKAAVMQLAG